MRCVLTPLLFCLVAAMLCVAGTMGYALARKAPTVPGYVHLRLAVHR
jgi:hypothetical protein